MKNHPQFLPEVEVISGPFFTSDAANDARYRLEDDGDARNWIPGKGSTGNGT